jgi:hypothetical protein
LNRTLPDLLLEALVLSAIVGEDNLVTCHFKMESAQVEDG